MKPLRGGLKLEPKKEATLTPWTAAKPSLPVRVRIPLVGPDGSEVEPVVRPGERVLTGQKIAAFVHASLSGTVSEIKRFPHPLFGEARAVEIISDGRDERVAGTGTERHGWESLAPLEIVRILRESGVLDLGADITPPASIDTVVINGCESEPYLTSDHSLMMSHPVEILKGGEILRRALGAKDLVVALEDNKEEVSELLKSKVFFHTWTQAQIELFPTRYPQGDPRVLVRSLFERAQKPGRTPRETSLRIVGIPETYAAFEAVVMQKPFYERIVTISGECVVKPGNFWVRVGTLANEAVKFARGFLRPPGRTVHGGPMQGTALESLDVPLLKETPGLLGIPHELVKSGSVDPCIRCGRCVEVCPVSISPVTITLAAEKGLWDVAEEEGAHLCIECGNCAYVCPSRRPMVELIRTVHAHAG